MRARLTKVIVGLAAVSALAFGGAALAGAANSPPPPAPPAAVADADTTQQGDQTTPDTGAQAPESSSESTASESASEVAGPEDGPGGHADDPANASLDYQFEGVQ